MYMCLFTTHKKNPKAVNSFTWVKMKFKISEMNNKQRDDESKKEIESQEQGWQRINAPRPL